MSLTNSVTQAHSIFCDQLFEGDLCATQGLAAGLRHDRDAQALDLGAGGVELPGSRSRERPGLRELAFAGLRVLLQRVPLRAEEKAETLRIISAFEGQYRALAASVACSPSLTNLAAMMASTFHSIKDGLGHKLVEGGLQQLYKQNSKT